MAHASAARRVAGPAPPRSWRQREAPSKGGEEAVCAPEREASVDELVAAETFLGRGPKEGRVRALDGGGWGVGPPSLVDVCLELSLRLLRDETVVWEPEQGEEEGPVTMREAVLAGACELDLHLRAALLSTSALLPPPSALRLADGDIRALLEYEVPGETQPSQPEDEDEWDTDAAPRPMLHHMPLTAHPAPLRLLRDVPRLSALALTSLDLAFAALPPLERVVAVLPAGLRALGLAGVRAAPRARGVGTGGAGYEGWERGLGALARKMIVLQVSLVSPQAVAAIADSRPSTYRTSPSERALPSPRSFLLALGAHSISRPSASWVCGA